MRGEHLCSFQAAYHLVEPPQALTFSQEKRMFTLWKFHSSLNKNATGASMQGQLLYKVGSSSIQWKHPFCQRHATLLCSPWSSKGAQPPYVDPEAPCSCLKATLPDRLLTRAAELDLMVPHCHSSYSIRTAAHDRWREQASQVTVFAANKLFRAAGTRPFRKSWACD